LESIVNGRNRGVDINCVHAIDQIDVDGTIETTAQNGEFIIVNNAEDGSIIVVFGTTRNMASTMEDGQVTTAGSRYL
jgi:hypothetical protein